MRLALAIITLITSSAAFLWLGIGGGSEWLNWPFYATFALQIVLVGFGAAALEYVEPFANSWKPFENLARKDLARKQAQQMPQRRESVSPRPQVSGARDTATALRAMRLAKAYIDEFLTAGPPRPSDVSDRQARLSTLALASRQIAKAEAADPDAVLEAKTEGGNEYRLTLNNLKVQVLLQEAGTHQAHDLRKALPAAEKAVQLDPNDDTAYYILGSIHFENRNRSAAIQAFSRAVELKPDDMEYAKLLDRAEAMSSVEVAGYKAARVGEKAITVGSIVWTVLKVLFFPVVIVIQAVRFMQKHLSGYR